MPVTHEQSRTLQRYHLKFRCLAGTYAILRSQPQAPIPDWATRGDFISITRTPDELSIVCPTESVPERLRLPQRWTCLKLEGPFPFSQTGILLSFIEPLSDNRIPIFALATYDTDYVLIQEEFAQRAMSILQQAGHELLTSQ